MNWSRFRCLSVAPFGLGVALLMGLGAMGAQAPGGPPAPKQEPVPERDRLIRQAEELRQAGKLDEAVAAAERALELERHAGGEASPREAEALARLAELHELRGDWVQAVGRRKEALAIRMQVDGKEHWRTADARLALAFAEKVAGLGQADRARLGGALRREQEAARLEEQGKFAEAERVALEALETYRALVSPESAEVARAWHRIGRCRSARHDAGGAKEANERALAIRRKVLPGTHPDLGRSLNNLGLAESSLGNKRRAREFLEEAVRLWRASLESSSPLTAMGLSNLGAVQNNLGEHAAAKRSHEEALAIRRKALPKDHPDIAASLNNLGVVLQDLQDHAAAKASFQEALVIRRAALPKDHPDIAQTLSNLGWAQWQTQEAEAARKSLEEALGIYRKAINADRLSIVQDLVNLGFVCESLKDYAAAKASYEEALAIRLEALPPGHSNIADTYYRLGRSQHDLREYEAAKVSLKQALAIYRRVYPKDHTYISTSLDALGAVHLELREYAVAKSCFAEELGILRRTLPPDHPEIAASLNNLGNAQKDLREYPAAKASYEEALAIFRKVLPKDDPQLATNLNNLGVLQSELREYVAARASHEEALAIRRKALPPGDPAIGDSFYGLGQVQGDLMEYAAARASYEQALEIYRKALPSGHPYIADTMHDLGHVLWELGERATAKTMVDGALAIRRKSLPPDHQDIAISLNSLGLMQRDLRDYEGATQSYEEGLAISRKALPPDPPFIAAILNNLGSLQQNLRDFAGARARYEESLAICRKALPKDHPKIAFSLVRLAWLGLATDKDLPDSVSRAAEASDLFRTEQLRLAVAQAEPEQLAMTTRAKLSVNFLVDATLAARRDPSPTYDRVVCVKGSVTAQQRWARQARDAADPETVRLLDQLQQVTKQLFGLSLGDRPSSRSSDSQAAMASLRSLCDERARLERQLTERSAAYHALQARAAVGGREIRAALPKGTALIDIVGYLHVQATAGEQDEAFEERLVAFVVRPVREVAMVPLGPTRLLAGLIHRWRASYGAGMAPPAGEPDPAAELRKRLWEPLDKHLEGVKVVLISPDGPLNGLPWAALPGSNPGTFLVQEYAFAIVPVPQLLPELLRDQPRRDKEPPSLFLAGGIDFGEGQARDPKVPAGKLPPVPFFRPLPGAESEVNDLWIQFRDAFPDVPPPRPLRKDKATKQAVLAAASAHRFVHLATHGFFADESEPSAIDVAQRADLLRSGFRLHAEAAGRHPGLLSGLVFAGVNRPDRPLEETVLTALEAAELNLDKVELVVLSACDTGRGRVAGGEGVLGLQRAFQLAGARSVVASLWKVPDEETHQLMREFYRRVWSEQPVSRAEALRQAQLWMLENWKGRGGVERPGGPQGAPPPYVWAAFVLSGDWR